MTTREIVLVTPSLRGGGAERCLLILTRGLQGSGHPARLVSLWSDTDYDIADLGVLFARQESISGDAGYRALLSPLPDVLADALNDADVILSNQWAADISVGRYLHGTRRCLKKQKHWTVGVQTDVGADIGAGWKGAVRLGALQRYRRYVNKIVVCSPTMHAQAERYLRPTAQTRVVVAPNPADPDVPLRIRSTRDRPRLITAGRFVHQKGYDMALEVARQLREWDVCVQWDIYGDGPLRASLQHEIETTGLASTMRLHPFDEALYRRLGSYDVFVSTSRWEPFGNVMAEALMCGTPVVTTNTDGGVYVQSLVPDAVWVGHAALDLAHVIHEAPWNALEPGDVASSARGVFSPARVAERWL